MTLFECRFKFSEEDNVRGTMDTMKVLNRNGFMIFCQVMVWLAFACSLIAVIFVACIGESVTEPLLTLLWISLFVVLWLCIPLLQKSAAKKSYQKTLADKDEMVVQFDESRCIASFYKNGEETNKQIIELNTISNIIEHDDEMTIIFDKRQFVIVKKQYLSGDWDLFKKLVYSFNK